jgi:NAD(P)-dependent dehydrogenase (short-subunit alcohol dehydrogenase family)
MSPRVAVVTGGASGMGRVYALRMAQAGTLVAVLDNSSSSLLDMAEESGNIHTYLCDVTNLDQIQQLLIEVEQRLGAIDRLVHCAAIMPAGSLNAHPTENIHFLMSVNYGGTVNVVTSMLNTMQARNRGEIVVFGSLGGHMPVAECGAYCASKAAVNMFTEILIEENRDSGVHIMLVCPSLVNTPLLKQATESGNPASVSYSIEHKRFATPDSIIDAIERGLGEKISILYPNAESRFFAWLRRFSPRLVWKMIHLSNKALQSRTE